MSIINSYLKDGTPLVNVSDTYSRSDITLDAIIITFSKRIIAALLEDAAIEIISLDAVRSISDDYPIYRFKGTNIGIFKTGVGAAITSVLMEEFAYIYNCNKVILFGTCGSLDRNISPQMLIVPTSAYRDEGVSYHYMEVSDYVDIPNSKKIEEIFTSLGIVYVSGKTWTTDAFYRETKEEIELRRNEGCIAVEMEIAGCQALATHQNIDFYPFLYRADNLDSKTWDKGLRDRMLSKDDRLKILNVAFLLAKAII